MSNKSKSHHKKPLNKLKKIIEKHGYLSVAIVAVAVLLIVGSGIFAFILSQQKTQKPAPVFVNLEQKNEPLPQKALTPEENLEIEKLNSLLVSKDFDKLSNFTDVMLPPNTFPVGVIDADKRSGWRLGYETTLATPVQENGRRQALVQNVSSYTQEGIESLNLSKSELPNFQKQDCSGIGDQCVIYFRANPDNIDTYRLYFKQKTYLVYFEYAGENTIVENDLNWLKNIASEISNKINLF